MSQRQPFCTLHDPWAAAPYGAIAGGRAESPTRARHRRKKKCRKDGAGARHPEGRGRRPGAHGRRRHEHQKKTAGARARRREFAKEAAKAAAPPPKPRPPAPKGEAALRPLERLLDRLSGVAATARRASEDPFCNVRARCKVVARAALDARLDARGRNLILS